jgi:tRNA (guanine26-N2/guanine27-N2)-dimethyltransferase
MLATETLSLVIPEGYSLHTKNTAKVLLPLDNGTFLNPIQEFNRDLSVACINIWSKDLNRRKEVKWTWRAKKANESRPEKKF